MPENKIIVLDFGGQYANLLARRVREMGVFAEIALPDAPIEKLREAKGLILSGSPYSIVEEKSPAFNPEIFSSKIPMLGVCYGMQLIARELGGKIGRCEKKEFGKTEMIAIGESPLFIGVPEKSIVWMSHNDEVVEPPKGFEIIGSTGNCRVAAMANEKEKIYGVQFHPEVAHTEFGMEMLASFVLDICECKKEWSMQGYLEKAIAEIRQKAGDKKVLLLASGGVDSTVTLALLGMALDQEKVFALHVDTGLMREGETSAVEKALQELELGKQLKVVDYSKEFFKALEKTFDPEKKREIIGKLFLEITKKEVEKLGFNENEWVLAQGTIYPDTIETARTKYADRIKTHHNRIEEIAEMVEKGAIIEPLSELYKDEVRELGKLVGLSDDLVWRHPFPGPGLGIRVLCSEGKALEKKVLEQEKKAREIAEKHGFKAAILPVKSVGVAGDLRTYKHPVLLSGALDWEKLEKASIELTNSLQEINRVVFLVIPENVKKIKAKKAFVDKKRTELCRKADAIANKIALEKGIQAEIWQFPVVLLPIQVNGKGEAVVLRPVQSKEAMTAEFYKMEPQILKEMASSIMKTSGIGAILYDITNKPPATIEWE
ncbi:MAG: glutamine-hydrolyzing GMP synthase [Candidatus Diapherotrites archaeon]